MNKKKSIICTILFAIVFYAIIIGTYFIRTKDGTFSLFQGIAYTVTGAWSSDCIEKFYKWLRK